MASIVLIAALDTKGAEAEFVKRELEARGQRVVVMDVGVLGAPPFLPDVTREQAARAGGADVDALKTAADRGAAVTAMARGVEATARRLHAEGRVDAVLGLGGSAGTTIATAAMRALPIGIPKVMVSTLAGSDVSAWVGIKDIIMVPAVVDLAGLNRISRRVLAQAAGAVCGMLEARLDASGTRPLVAASMFGNTTPCVERVRDSLERAGYEVLTFHATGAGGRTLESLVEAGDIRGVADVTTTEWADELVGGVLAAGPARLEAAARSGTPAVVAPGCLDMVNFWAPETIPEKFRGRTFYRHNPNVTLMRTTPDECAELGQIIASKLNLSTGPAAVYLPLRGVSMISAPGGPFHWPEADAALFEALERSLRPDIPVERLDCNINDAAFADRLTEGLLALLSTTR
jgi:uncharacterized protein (UPF0261 family)